MFERLAQDHERAFLSVFFASVLVGLVAFAVEASGRGNGAEVLAAWGVGAAVTALLMAARHRTGQLILRKASGRKRQAEVNEASRRSTPFAVAGFAVVALIGGVARDIAFAALGGVLTMLAPVLLWIAFVLRPDERPDDDL